MQHIGCVSNDDLVTFLDECFEGFDTDGTSPALSGAMAMLVEDHPAQRAQQPGPASLISPLSEHSKQAEVEDTKEKLLDQILRLMLVDATLTREMQQFGKVLMI